MNAMARIQSTNPTAAVSLKCEMILKDQPRKIKAITYDCP